MIPPDPEPARPSLEPAASSPAGATPELKEGLAGEPAVEPAGVPAGELGGVLGGARRRRSGLSRSGRRWGVHDPRVRYSLAILLLALSLWLIAAASGREHRVCVADADELHEFLGFYPHQAVSEFQLVEDTTFTGVTRRDGRLYSTYDRSKPAGKRACPT
ncbi:MAG: hypothetical protein AB1486_32070 [Planctomycetota bacterium]